jgi:hypothetical protein
MELCLSVSGPQQLRHDHTIFFIQGDSSFTAGGKIDLKNYDFPFIFCRPNLLSIRHIISKNEIYKLIRSNFAIFSIVNCLIYSTL